MTVRSKPKYDHVDAINFQKAKPAYKGKELQGFQAEGVRVIILEKNYKQGEPRLGPQYLP